MPSGDNGLRETTNLFFPLTKFSTDFHLTCSPDQTIELPYLNLTMKGGDDYYVTNPIIPVFSEVRA